MESTVLVKTQDSHPEEASQKEQSMSHFRFYRIATVFCFALLLINIPLVTGQDLTATSAEENDAEADAISPFKILVSVNEVRLDVVVVDGKGRPITDLTANDFEIYQNDLPREVVSSIYIENQTEAAGRPAASRKDAPNLTAFPTTVLKEEEIRRTIVFVVDDLSMQFDHLHNAKISMKGFLESQMQSGDLVAIMRTSSGNSALQTFLSDKRLINERIESIPHTGPTEEDYKECMESAPTFENCPMHEGKLHRMYGNQLSTLSYNIRALSDMPGRKILLFLSAYPTIKKPPPVIFDATPRDYYELYGPHFERLANDALRAGVVVHSMDVRGLEYYEPGGPRDMEKMDASNPLPAKTGGTYTVDNNFFLAGIGREMNNMIAGYYLLSYVPPSTTFKASRRDVFHRVEVKVKRRGTKVYTRDGFYGRLDNETDSDSPAKHPLQDAIFSPFRHADINVNIAAGYIKNDKAGYLVRSWVHLDPKNVTIAETEDGGALIDLETLILTSDINGFVQDERHTKYTLDIKPEKKLENLAWIQKHGIRFSLLLPVKKPGHYTVRIAVLDTESGKVGSAHQSVVIPDLEKPGMALSDVFMITSAEDLVWIFSDVAKEISEGVFSMVFQDGEVRSPALRTYAPGDSLQTMAMLYNADAEEIARSEIEMQSILYKDGKEFQRGKPEPIALGNKDNTDSIAILRKFTIGRDMPPGDYLLQLLVTDQKNSLKRDNEGVTSQKAGGGLFSRIMRAYINTPKVYSATPDKGVASQTLSFTIKEE